MKNPMYLKITLSVLFAMFYFTSIAQNYEPFTPRFDADTKGDILLIGNNIVNRSTNSYGPNVPYNGTNNYNSDYSMQYIDIDGDPTTFSSSSANLEAPGSCYSILYAGLYWGAIYQESDRSPINQLKFKMPGGTYSDITGEIIYDAATTPIGGDNSKPYACYADVTGLLQSLADPAGTYTVGNMTSSLGYHGGTGLCGGWSLFVVYEDPALPGKAIVSFDGFSAIGGTTTLDVPVSGFRTIPVGPVRAKFAFSALEGDFKITGDRLRINGISMNTPERPANNFFNSKITNLAGEFTNREPNSLNTLGFDAGILNVPNGGNSVINNGDTAATIRLASTGDVYFYYFNAFAVDIIQPNITLTKNVENTAGVNINDGDVTLGQELDYILSFENIGNDDAINYTITDVLPINVDLMSVNLTGAPGVTYTYDAVTHALTFTIPNNLINEGDPTYTIRIRVKVIEDCNQLRDACSNIIQNQAYQTYSSFNSGNVVANQVPSVSDIDVCGFPTPGSTNFLVNVDGCTFIRDEVLCGSSIQLTAGSGYTAYQWYQGDEMTGTPIGATQTITITTPGVYTSVNTAAQPCVSIVETVNVILFGADLPNPITPYANQVVICPINEKELPEIFLCGAGDAQLLETNITDAISISWALLDEGSCGEAPANCPNTSASCTWNQVATGPTYNLIAAGQYQLTITYQNGCFRKFYFNVYQNLFTPTEVHRDIVCSTDGEITINGVPASYEYSINGVGGPYQISNVFPITVAGDYTVHIRPIGITNPCIFTIINIPIRARNFTVDVIPNQPLCSGDKGGITVQMNDVTAQYYYEILQGGTIISAAGPIAESDYTFPDLNPGTYTVNASNDAGCTYTETITLVEPDPITLTANLTQPLTCTDGEITIVANGGTPPYFYYINSTTEFQTVPEYEVLTAGTYDITVIDFNNCTQTTQIIVEALEPPTFNVTHTDVLCYGDESAEINFNVTGSNGYTLAFSIDGGNTYSSNPIISNLPAGTYETLVQYSINGEDCLTTAETVVITQPDTALSASGGVSALAGCGPNGEGEVRITNPQGGIAPYQYSFDNGVTYGSANSAYVAPGTYTLYIRDVNGCIFPMEVTISPAPTAPTIDISDTDFNCDGSGNSTVTVNNNGGNFAYTYVMDGVENTNVPDNVFVNVPSGNHTITVQYENLNIPTYSNLLFEDFGRGGNTTTPGIAAAYCFHDQTISPSPCGPSDLLQDNQYAVTNRIFPIYGTWFDYRDHTSGGSDPQGRFLAVNIGSAAGPYGILYSKPINNVLPGQDVIVDLYLANLLSVGSAGGAPDFILELVDGSGNVIASEATGPILNTVNAWQLKSVQLNPGANTELIFNIRSGSVVYNGNDAVIDDINVYQIPRVCITEVEFPIVIDSNQAFSAQVLNAFDVSCSGAADGQITIAANNFQLPYGFDYSTDGGTTWINSATSPVIITGLAGATYDVQIRYDDTAATCSFSFTQPVLEPNALIAGAVIASPATCLSGATIEASASNGTPNYTFQLENSVGTVIVPFQSGNTFSNVIPGDYIVVVQDANGCQDPIDTALTIAAPTTPIASIDASSDICYDAGNLATIVVGVSDGTAPYTYSINGGTFQSNNTFTNLTPGTYSVIVRDAYGCESDAISQTIGGALIGTAILTKNLDCRTNPNASILTTIAGGIAPYTYDVSYNGGPFAGNTTVVGNAFVYSTGTDGTYTFLITDSLGCTTQTSVINIIPLPLLDAPTVTVTQNNLCFGDNSGAITVVPSGGLSPYTILVENTTTGTNYGSQTTGLEAGVYTITVTDANTCSITETATITQPDAIAYDVVKVDITCDVSGGTSTGTITVENVSGGTPEYTYYVSNNFGYSASYPTTSGGEDHTFTIIDYGIYTVDVVDANGCSLVTQNITIASPPGSLVIDITTLTSDCSTGGTAVITVTPVVSSGNYEFAVLEYNTIPYSNNYQNADSGTPETSTFTGLTPGVTYTFVVHDMSNDCYYFETATGPIDSLSNLSVVSYDVNNVTCTGNGDGSVSFTIDNYDTGATGVAYEIFNFQSNVSTGITGTISPLSGGAETVSNVGPLASGQYYILLSEIGGAYNDCSAATSDFNITESSNLLAISANLTASDNCNVDAGVITATGQFGTPPYEFQLNVAGDPAPDTATWTGASTNIFNVEGGNWDVYVQDAYGCIQMASVFVPTDTPPAITLAIDATTTCNVEGNFSMVITRDNTVGVAPFTYSVDGSAFNTYTEDASNSFTITGLNSGAHTVTVQDANGCTDIQNIIILTPISGLSATSISASPDCGASDGIITMTVDGGSGVYAYTILPNDPSITLTGNIFENVPAGDYTITITDSGTSCSIDVPASIQVPVAPSIAPVATDVTCNGGTNGTITVNLTGTNADPVYSYEITSPIIVGPQSTNTFTGLAAGVYTVAVTSGRGCVTSETITINEPAVIAIATTTVVDFACIVDTNTVNNATITISGVTGGSGTYINYEFIQGATTLQFGTNNVYNETNPLGGTYTINVYDNNGCVGTTTATINPYTELLTSTINIDSPIDCNTGETITITANFNGGIPAILNYTVIGLNGNPYNLTQTTPTFTDLTVGNYSIIVENPVTGCQVETVHYVSDPNTFDVLATVVSNVTCFGVANGIVQITFIDQNTTPTDDAGPFYYVILDNTGTSVQTGSSPTAGPLTITSLASGIYTFEATLTNNPFCPASINFTITGPSAALMLQINSAPVTCVLSANDGSISASASLGWGAPYEYQLELGATVISPWSATNIFNGLSAGTYLVSVRDANGCVVSANETLVVPTSISGTLTANPTDLACFNDANATLTVSAISGGAGSGYLYTLINEVTGATSGPQTSPIFTGIPAGTYHVDISDAWTCSNPTNIVIITQPLDIATGIVSYVNTATCNNDAEIHIEVSGGTPPYTYSTDGVNFTILSPTNSFFVTAGTYQYYIQDSNGCDITLTNSITVNPVIPVFVNLDLSGSTINCSGGTNGTIFATATDGLGNYSYELIDTVTNTTVQGPQASGTFIGIGAGNYQVNVSSGIDCTGVSEPIIITDPDPLIVSTPKTDISCFGLTDGSITIDASGGTGTFQYAISPNLDQFHNSNVFDNLPAGIYTVVAQDANGCFESFEIEIIEPDPLQATFGTIGNELCLNDGNGTITINITGGSGSYLVSLDNTNFTPVVGSEYTFTDLSGDTFYQIFIVDSNNCYVNPPLEYYMPPAVEVIPSVVIDVTCISNTPGNIVTLSVNPEVDGDVQYSTDYITFSATNVFTDLAPGIYTYYVQHTNGCTKEIEFTIQDLDPITASADVSADVLCFGEATGSITVTATGGTGTLEYAISPSFTFQTDNIFTGLEAGSYDVIVRDTITCELTISNLIISQPVAELSATISGTVETCLNAADGTINVVVSGGTPPYFTSTDGINFTQDVFDFTGLAGNQTYTIYVKDANDCEILPLTYFIDEGVDIQGAVVIVDNCTNNVVGNDVTVTFNATLAGDLQFSTDGVNYVTGNVFTDFASGNHTIYVQHTNGCIQEIDFTIDNLVPITASVGSTVDVLCFGEATGSITVSATGGTGTLEYAISPDYDYQTSNTFDILPAGTYDIIVRDTITCEVTLSSIVIAEPATAITATIQATVPETCINAADGEITITVSGGTAPYYTSLDGINFTQDLLTFTGLNGGQTYTIYVKDDSDCEIVPLTYTIVNGVDIQGAVVIVDNCTANVVGNEVTVTFNAALAGDLQFSTDGVTYGAGNVFTDFAPGNHTIYVQHTNGCIQEIDFNIDNLLPITASVGSTVDVLCFGEATGSITVTATGGTGTLEYAISPDYDYQASNTFDDLPAGTYDIIVRDTITCEVTISSVIISQPAAELSAIISGTAETCLNAADGTINLVVSGGTPPYFTSTDGINFTQDVFDFTGLAGGQTYTIHVKDANDCEILPLTYTIEAGFDIQASVSIVDTCVNNVNSNEITINVSSTVVGNVQYSLDGISYGNSNVFTGLADGNYTAYVQHINGCIDTAAFTVTSLAAITMNLTPTNVLCNGEDSGSILVSASGGTNNLTYALSPNYVQTASNVFNDLVAGNYTIRVYDETGCYIEDSTTISQPNALLATLISTYEEICVEDDNGEIEISIPAGAGTAPYFTSLNNENNYVQDQYIFDGLDGGQTYTIYIKDGNDCTTTLDVTLQAPTFIDASPEVIYTCDDNVVTINVDPSVANDVMYFLDGGIGQASNVYNGLSAGNHSVEIIHAASGCSETVPFFINTVIPLGLTVVETGINQVTATASGGSGGYTYFFNGYDNGSNNVFTYYESGTIVVRVVDQNGCEITQTLQVVFVDIEIPNVFTPDGNGQNDEWGPGKTENYPDIRTLIYDRHGRVVGTLRQGQTWNGEYNGNPLPTGDYWYVINLGSAKDNREFVGHFTLYR
ncbi:T9SS type B sorting domain-containing protein [Bizionia myxarmorum]|uniref:T9SS type B sorting domain-containing protein n=1 Tax=Bizionia myxarmorum TaxID=291186 RepID=A0A5D0R1E0_9FLAO|nr:T9SS type B sorting domain-containing protein [Bizionia myxarmorum]TYB74314.1 T9SS type B sorting domain-containing protein [Bizionia myxarmorum]